MHKCFQFRNSSFEYRPFVLAVLWFISVAGPCLGREVDMKAQWNDRIALENPHKGWYHHFPDNSIDKYIIAQDSDLTEFPGLDHVYVRLAWAYLEPREGQFNWDIIDQIIEKWVGHGLGIAFRLSCKETSVNRIEQQFATPGWVMEAGAKGGYYRGGKQVGPEGPWEPVFDDPIFLEKLEDFLKAFAQRYDGQPWLRYVDIGSIGDWGEGHTHSGSQRAYNYEQRKVHVDLHLRCFTQSQLVISDDFVYSIADKDERFKMHQYVVENGLTYRDDSPLVDYYVGAYPETYSLRSPEYFDAVYKAKPTVFELQHYGSVKKDGNWTNEPGSSIVQNAPGKTGPDFFRGAMEMLHATYIGYHGYAHEWLADNPELTVELLNRCGYWYFPHTVRLPDVIKVGDRPIVTITWENRGVAPAYHPYDIVLRLSGPDTITVNLPAGNQTWLPSAGKNNTYRERYPMVLPERLKPGQYTLSLKLFSSQVSRTVFLPLNPEMKDSENFYRVCTVSISER
ncbi:MAG: DUF4832 domain-containing protein [Phycisphaerae bacterium]|nr:DUF4832 domain-containing protein [Phycisphaerae bacterium]